MHPVTVDLAGLNGGSWQMVCLFGGYTDPIKVMRKQGAFIQPIDEKRMAAAHRTDTEIEQGKGPAK